MIANIINYIDKYISLESKSKGLCVLIEQGELKLPAKPKGNDYELIANFDKLNDFSYWRINGEITVEPYLDNYSVKRLYNLTYPIKLVLCKKKEKKEIGYEDTMALSIISKLKDLKKSNKEDLNIYNINLNAKSYDIVQENVIGDEFGDTFKKNNDFVFISFVFDLIVTVDNTCLNDC